MLKNLLHILHHVVIVVLSAGIALSLPSAVAFLARKFLLYWSFVESQKVFLISVEIALAVTLILFFNYLGRSWKDRLMSAIARGAGLVFSSSVRGPFARTRQRKMREKQGFGRDVMIIGSTGYRTLADPAGDLHRVLHTCREARILLLDPTGEGARARARSLTALEEGFREQIRRSIGFLKGLKAVQKNIRLKLYRDAPLFKLAILGDYLYVRHYHPGLDVRHMPEFVFKHGNNPGSFYNPLYQYFQTRWHDPSIPEYDLETDELVYRDITGNELKRTAFLLPDDAEEECLVLSSGKGAC